LATSTFGFRGGRVALTRAYRRYRPQFFFRTADVTGVVEMKEEAKLVMPGENAEIIVNLISPIPMHEGLKFSIREGGRTVGFGAISKILD